ncbi:hypothetical protein LXL04_040168 [Taraxacum kok-saghyz]
MSPSLATSFFSLQALKERRRSSLPSTRHCSNLHSNASCKDLQFGFDCQWRTTLCAIAWNIWVWRCRAVFDGDFILPHDPNRRIANDVEIAVSALSIRRKRSKEQRLAWCCHGTFVGVLVAFSETVQEHLDVESDWTGEKKAIHAESDWRMRFMQNRIGLENAINCYIKWNRPDANWCYQHRMQIGCPDELLDRLGCEQILSYRIDRSLMLWTRESLISLPLERFGIESAQAVNKEEALATVGLSAVGGRGDGMSEVEETDRSREFPPDARKRKTEARVPPGAKCEFIAGFGVVQIKEFQICGLSESEFMMTNELKTANASN